MNEQDRLAEQQLLEYVQLSGAERYAAFLESVARTGKFWVAVSGEFVLTLFDEDGQELLPAWPSAATARASLVRAPQLQAYAPAERELSAWRDRAAASMREAGVVVGVFPNERMHSAAVDVAQLLAHLDDVLADEGELDGEDDDAAAEPGPDAGLDLERAQRELAQKFAKPREP
ncbi:DUF2750 domain-containing protein [Lysobacter capsici]|jgi:hypothetical protein|uniref:DUF2750 domain-containing protein n=1 Tax=Lysobacter capsici TaxID=435897 RepID=UPI000BBAF0D2|nr:DUF2750 domain-containing protein [Lysobacter capsici]ATE70051.1 hypothetical protein CNO08_00840 [Lysobacter capsici]UOF15249.1 DUF2750 domain-containing protein [Lysobacter capsici]